MVGVHPEIDRRLNDCPVTGYWNETESESNLDNETLTFISVLVVVIFMAFCVVHLVCSTNKGIRIIDPKSEICHRVFSMLAA